MSIYLEPIFLPDLPGANPDWYPSGKSWCEFAKCPFMNFCEGIIVSNMNAHLFRAIDPLKENEPASCKPVR